MVHALKTIKNLYYNNKSSNCLSLSIDPSAVAFRITIFFYHISANGLRSISNDHAEEDCCVNQKTLSAIEGVMAKAHEKGILLYHESDSIEKMVRSEHPIGYNSLR